MLPQDLLIPLAVLGPIVFGAAVLCAARLIIDRRATADDDVMYLVLGVIGRVLIAVGCLAIFLRTFMLFSGLFIIVSVFAMQEIVQHTLSSRRKVLMGMLASAARHKIPLVPAIEAYADEQGGRRGFRARRLAAMVSAGVALPTALQRCRGLVPPEVLPLVRVGHDTGSLDAAFQRATTSMDSHAKTRAMVHPKAVYIAVVLGATCGILLSTSIFVIPSYVEIFADFETELPLLTHVLFGSSSLLYSLLLFASLTFVSVAFVGLGRSFLQMATGKRWPLPGEGWFFRALYSASVLDALSLAAERQHPLPETLRALAESDPRGWIRRRLKQALVDIEAGREWCESLYAQGLLRRTDVAVLRSAQRTGNLAWAIQEMADGNRRSFFRRLETCIHIGLPPIVIMIGIVVLFIVAALFLPLVVMIESLT